MSKQARFRNRAVCVRCRQDEQAGAVWNRAASGRCRQDKKAGAVFEPVPFAFGAGKMASGYRTGIASGIACSWELNSWAFALLERILAGTQTRDEFPNHYVSWPTITTLFGRDASVVLL